MKESIYVIDIETDHLYSSVGSIVEIGIVRLNLKSGIIYPVFSSIVRETRDIDATAWIFKNSSLKYEKVNEAKFLIECFSILQKLFLQGVFTAFNQKFDFGWLESRGFRIPNKFFDPMLVLTPIMKLPHPYYVVKYPSVEEAYYFMFDKKINESHRAIEDAEIEAKIIKEMWKRRYFNTVEREVFLEGFSNHLDSYEALSK